MSNSAMIRNSIETFNRRILHTKSEESGKNSFGTGSEVINFFKGSGAVREGSSDINISSGVRETAVAVNKFGMIPWTGREVLSEAFRMSNRADKFFSNFTSVFKFTPVLHFKPGNTNRDSRRREFNIGIFSPSWVSGDIRSSIKHIFNKMQDVFSVVSSISSDKFYREREVIFKLFKERNKKFGIIYISGYSFFDEREFRKRVGNGVIFISPEVLNFFLKGIREIDDDTNASIFVTFRKRILIKAVANRSFKIVLLNFYRDRAGIDRKDFSLNVTVINKFRDKVFANRLKDGVWCISEERRKSFNHGKMIRRRRKTAFNGDTGIVHHIDSEVKESGKRFKVFVDESFEKGGARGRWSSAFGGRNVIVQRGTIKVREENFIPFQWVDIEEVFSGKKNFLFGIKLIHGTSSFVKDDKKTKEKFFYYSKDKEGGGEKFSDDYDMPKREGFTKLKDGKNRQKLHLHPSLIWGKMTNFGVKTNILSSGNLGGGELLN